jgi:hypothetical protein
MLVAVEMEISEAFLEDNLQCWYLKCPFISTTPRCPSYRNTGIMHRDRDIWPRTYSTVTSKKQKTVNRLHVTVAEDADLVPVFSLFLTKGSLR